MRGMKITAFAFALLLMLNACGSHQAAAPAEPSESAEAADSTQEVSGHPKAWKAFSFHGTC